MQSYMAVPMTTPDGKLLGVQIEPKSPQVLESVEKKRLYLFDLLGAISTRVEFFKRRELFCLVAVDEEMAVLLTYEPLLRAALTRLTFVKLVIAQRHAALMEDLSALKNAVWIEGVGGDLPFTQTCEAVILDEAFTRTEIEKNTFPILVENLRRYCDRVIVKHTDTKNRRLLFDTAVWGVKGMYKPIAFNKVHTLM
nr:hypothetical protein [uncultured Enterobacter sp.]